MIIAFVATQQSNIFDRFGDRTGSAPVLVQPITLSASSSLNSWALETALPADLAATTVTREQFNRFIDSSGAVPVGNTRIDVALEGNRNESVIIEQISARVIESFAPPSGTIILPEPAGGPGFRVTLGFNLDEANPSARIPDGKGALGEPFNQKNYFEVNKNEKFVFSFYGTAKTKTAYRWVIDLSLIVGSQHKILTVGDPNKSYTLTGPTNTYLSYYQWTGSSLEPKTAQELCGNDCTLNANDWARVF
jgi:hypothetical protein